MSLLRLLTSGKCLVGLKDPACRYQVKSKGLLPEFATRKNPFRNRTPVVTPSVPVEVPAPLPGLANHPAANEVAEPRVIIEKTAEPASKEPAATQADAGPGGATGLLARAWRLAGRLRNRLFGRGRSRSTAPIPRFNNLLVQAELSLDRVRVVRNDLSESDVELVASGAAGHAAGNGSKPGAVAAPAGSAWKRATSRLLGTGQS
jgi:hypothetical protein